METGRRPQRGETEMKINAKKTATAFSELGWVTVAVFGTNPAPILWAYGSHQGKDLGAWENHDVFADMVASACAELTGA